MSSFSESFRFYTKCRVRYISWLVSKVYNQKWKVYDKKRSPVKKRKFSRQKWLRKMHLKNVVITYKSQILKFKIQQKVFNKKDSE